MGDLTKLEVYAVVPKEATNLIANPSFELGTTGYLATNGSIAQSALQQRRGVYSLEWTPNTGVASNVYLSFALTNGTQYSFSADVLDVIGQVMQIYVTDSTAAPIGATTWIGNGHWKRRSITFTANANTPFSLIVQRGSIASTAKIYTDGWLLEVGPVSTYFDGDSKGFVRGQTDYYWLGTPHASQSYRSGQTRSGGTEVRFKDFMTILAYLGLGMSPVVNAALPNASGGSFYQSTVLDERTISLPGAFLGKTLGEIQKNRAGIENAVNPKLVGSDQPMVLRFKGYDSLGIEQAETLEARVQYSGGLEGNWDLPGLEKAAPQFHNFLPYLFGEGQQGQALTINQTVNNTDYFAFRDPTGTWKALGNGTNSSVYKIIVGLDGTLYVGGLFTLAGGVANTARIAKWAPGAVAWTPLGTGLNAGALFAMAIAPDGTLYAGGGFTLAGGVANTAYIAKWNGSAWSPLSTGAGNVVRALAFGPDGSLYVGGDFTNLGDANGDYIVKWNGSAWSSLGTGMNGAVQTLAVGPDGTLYAGGDFTSAGGVANTSHIAKWNGTAWSALGTGAADNSVATIVFGADGQLYVGGNFTAMGGVSNTIGIARWNGASWFSLGTGMSALASITALGLSGGNILVGGYYTTAGAVAIQNLALWNGSSWANFDIVPPGLTPLIYGMVSDRNNLYIGYINLGSSTAAYVQSITNTAGYAVSPKIILTGPGTVYQIKNVISGKTLYFNLTLMAGETAVLDLNPDNPSFISSFRGNIFNSILPGSNLDLTLLPGANNLSVFIAGTTSGATSCAMVWQPVYEHYDGAVY